MEKKKTTAQKKKPIFSSYRQAKKEESSDEQNQSSKLPPEEPAHQPKSTQETEEATPSAAISSEQLEELKREFHQQLVDVKQETKAELQEQFKELLDRVESWAAKEIQRHDTQIDKVAQQGILSDLSTLNDIAKQLDLLESQLITKLQEVDEFLKGSWQREAEFGAIAVYEDAMRMIRETSLMIGFSVRLVQNQRNSFDELTQVIKNSFDYKGKG